MKGEPIFAAVYTLLNEYEEVRGHSLTLDKSLWFVKDMFEGIQQGLKDSNNPPTEILYTDSPQCEFWEFVALSILIIFQWSVLSTSRSTAH